MESRVINPWTWQDQFGFVQANEVSNAQRVVYCAGQTSVDGDGNPLHEGDMRAQVGKALDNLETVLGGAGLDLSNVVRLNYYTTDIDALFESWDVLATRLGEAGARVTSTALGVARLAFPPLLVEIEATAVA
ncbi:MAG TPA: RidA family protein [Aeromicrobium sp.]|nr:RidA family protein [Aeromicrobium sp.]